jgi:hypothetical protein
MGQLFSFSKIIQYRKIYNSQQFCYVAFDKDGILVHAKPDNTVMHGEIDNDQDDKTRNVKVRYDSLFLYVNIRPLSYLIIKSVKPLTKNIENHTLNTENKDVNDINDHFPNS